MQGILLDLQERVNRLLNRGISISAARVFDHPGRVLFIERVIDGEQRWHLIGFVPLTVLLLVVVHTYPQPADENLVRISARPATKRERELYDKKNE